MPWPTLPTPNCMQANCSCPSPPKDQKKLSFNLSKPEDHPFPSPARPDDDRSPEPRDESSLGRYRRTINEEVSVSSPGRTDDDKSQDRCYSSASPTGSSDRASRTVVPSLPNPGSMPSVTISPPTTPTTSSGRSEGLAVNFSVQSLAGSAAVPQRAQHVI